MPSGKCRACNRWHSKLELDHIVARANGGYDDTSNLQWLCNRCHKKKTVVDTQLYWKLRKQRKAPKRRRTGSKPPGLVGRLLRSIW